MRDKRFRGTQVWAEMAKSPGLRTVSSWSGSNHRLTVAMGKSLAVSQILELIPSLWELGSNKDL